MPREFRLICTHIFLTEIAPEHGDNVWCGKCSRYSFYNGFPGKFSLKCMDCRFSKYHGGKLAMESAGITHKATKRHRVMIITPEQDMIVYLPSSVEPEGNIPPF